jgi:hypothetical protein
MQSGTRKDLGPKASDLFLDIHRDHRTNAGLCGFSLATGSEEESGFP